MSKIRRKFTPMEKCSILQDAERKGSTEICRKYNLAFSVLVYWKKKYPSKGREGLKVSYKLVDPQVRVWKREIFA